MLGIVEVLSSVGVFTALFVALKSIGISLTFFFLFLLYYTIQFSIIFLYIKIVIRGLRSTVIRDLFSLNF